MQEKQDTIRQGKVEDDIKEEELWPSVAFLDSPPFCTAVMDVTLHSLGFVCILLLAIVVFLPIVVYLAWCDWISGNPHYLYSAVISSWKTVQLFV